MIPSDALTALEWSVRSPAGGYARLSEILMQKGLIQPVK